MNLPFRNCARVRSGFHRTLTALAAACLLSAMPACTTNPATGQNQINLLDRESEIAMGVEAAPELTRQFGGKLNNADLQAYVTEIGRKIAASTEGDFPTLPWEFTLLDSDVINAFALPGGKVFISKGLARRMTNEAQLAAVLGHECGHVTARHINDKLVRENGANILLQIGSAVAGHEYAMISELAGQVATVALLKYDRGQESQADALGMRYMVRNNYDPLGARQVMEILRDAMAGGQRSPEILATHPYPETRIRDIDAAIRNSYSHTQGNEQYQLREQQFRARLLSKLAAHTDATSARGMLAAASIDRASASNDETSFLWCAVCAANEKSTRIVPATIDSTPQPGNH